MYRLIAALDPTGPRASGRDRETFPGIELLALAVVCDHHAAAAVRAALSEIAELAAVRSEVMLVASELVANAFMHSGGSAADTIEVRAVLTAGDVLISVCDPGLSGDSARMGDGDVSRASGRGLRIVNQLARQWGFERDRGYRVWAQLSRQR
jgi:anti-sigma regulatory factor (Ser/Thr protein kinase)